MGKTRNQWISAGIAASLALTVTCSAFAYEEEELVQEILDNGYYAVVSQEEYETALGQSQVVAVSGEGDALSQQLFAKSAVLLSGDTGETLYELNGGEQMPPASITKVMTLLLVMEALESGQISWEDTVTASAHACSMGGSQIWLKEGEQMTVEELVKAAAVASANDASVALAEHVAGSEEAFVQRMNERAEELGMVNTHFVNATGLDAQGHLTTAFDIALMSRELLSHQEIQKYTTTWMDTLRNGETSLVNTNKLVRFYQGTTGLKTGTTDGAGSCLSASAQRDGLSLIAVVMGCDTSDHRFSSARALLDYGFANYGVYRLDPEELTLPSVPVLLGEGEEVEGALGEIPPLLLPKGEEKKVAVKLEMEPKVEAPVAPGQEIGFLVLEGSQGELARYPVTAENGVKKRSTLFSMGKLLEVFQW